MQDKLLSIFKKVFKSDAITPDASHTTLDNWDSLKQLALIVAIECDFAISFEPEEIAQATSFSDLLNIIKSKKAQ